MYNNMPDYEYYTPQDTSHKLKAIKYKLLKTENRQQLEKTLTKCITTILNLRADENLLLDDKINDLSLKLAVAETKLVEKDQEIKELNQYKKKMLALSIEFQSTNYNNKSTSKT